MWPAACLSLSSITMEELPLRVVVLGEAPGFGELVRAVMGPAAVLEARDGLGPETDLVVAGRGDWTPDLLNEIGKTAPRAAILTFGADTRIVGFLTCRLPGQQLARMRYREVVALAGSETVGHYIRALLIRHEGNVTKAALAARLERESLHRLMRRHGLHAAAFRKRDA